MKSIERELKAWLQNPNSGTRPTEIGEDPNNLLMEARSYENGTYDCTDEDQKAKAEKAIEDFSAATEDYE